MTTTFSPTDWSVRQEAKRYRRAKAIAVAIAILVAVAVVWGVIVPRVWGGESTQQRNEKTWRTLLSLTNNCVDARQIVQVAATKGVNLNVELLLLGC